MATSLLASNLTDAEVIAQLVAAAPPLTTEQRQILAAQWRRDQQPCRPAGTSRALGGQA